MGTAGARQTRWCQSHYWITKNHQILFLTAYAKNEASDLSRDSIKAMREIVKDL